MTTKVTMEVNISILSTEELVRLILYILPIIIYIY